MQNRNGQDVLDSSAELMRKDGFVIMADFCSEELIKKLGDTAIQRLKDLRETLGDKEIGIGSSAGYKEICLRSRGRWDALISPKEFGYEPENLPWYPLMQEMLGEDLDFGMSGIISSEPNTPEQKWHIDSPHEGAELLPVHHIQVLIAINDIPVEMGPTEFARGSHILSNHINKTKLPMEQMVYQADGTSPETLVGGTEYAVPEAVQNDITAGTCIAFDDRVLHRGGQNKSSKNRHVIYFTYTKKGYNLSTHWESDASVFD
ncbi:MAG: phytanoyl-CoA dioxygenase family protein [Flavobacteriales bacterium]|nr:phytanoyl-CoA dioxygenase family protein [Flavobacteriales bacterium]